MMIENDQDFKQALAELSIDDQRKIASQFVLSVIHLNLDPVIKDALKNAQTNSKLDETYKIIKSLAVKTYTACGGDADWPAQAAHFVATAAKACLIPLERLENNSDTRNNLAWKCAMQTRMAKNCEMIEMDSNVVDNEAQKQYVITNEFLNL